MRVTVAAMSSAPIPGWYPDPGGAPGQVRHWDGQAWSAQTRPAAGLGSPPGNPRPRTPWLALAVGLALVVALVLFGLPKLFPSAPTTPLRPADSASPSVPGWDESPTPSPSPTARATSPSPTPQACAPGRSRGMAASNPVVAGGVRLARPSGWEGPFREQRLPFTADAFAYQQALAERPGWASSVTVGVLDDAVPYAGSEATARAILDCVAVSGGPFYADVTVSLASVDATPVTLGGVRGTQVDGVASFTVPGRELTGSLLRVVVLDTPEGPAVFFAAAPLDRADHLAVIQKATRELRG